MLKNAAFKIYMALFIAMLFWGFSFIWSKEVFVYYKPITTIFFRLIISSVFFILLNFWLKKIEKVERKDLQIIFLLSFLEPFLYFIGESYGLTRVSSTVTAVVIATIPLFSPIAAWYFFREKISRMNILGIFISICGVFMVILKNDLSLAADPVGILFLILAVITAIAYSVVIVKLSGRYHVYTIITYQNTIGVFLFLPVFLIVDLNDFLATGFLLKPFISIFQLALFASSLAFILFMYGIQKIGIIKANAFSNIIPVFTAFFAWLVLDETISVLNTAGILVVITGLFLSQLNHKTIAFAQDFFYRLKVERENRKKS